MSLRLRLLLAIGLSLAVLWTGATLWMLRDLDRSLQNTLDERLEMSARMVAGLISQSGSQGAMSISAKGALTVPGSQGMACQIRSLRGDVIATTRDGGGDPIAVSMPGFRTTLIDGQYWRTYTLRTDAFDITTADRLDERTLLQRRIALAAGLPFLIAAIGGLAALWFGVARVLAPLAGLRRTLASRDPDATDPVDGSRLPSELRPLIDALNGLLERVSDAIQRERNFTNDAAHELRTPLTAINTHLQVARLATNDSAREPLADAATGVERLRSTLDQLLMLARIEGRLSFDEGMHITAAETIERALAAARADALDRVIVSEVERAVKLDVPPQLAVVALRNLIDNALRYSPLGSRVVVECRADAAFVHFRVADCGPGLSAEEARAATRRFWRGRASAGGSGLGLALVEAIANRFGGSISLAPRQPQGLIAELVLSVRGSAPRSRCNSP